MCWVFSRKILKCLTSLSMDRRVPEWGEIAAPHYIPWVCGLPDIATNTLPSMPWSHPLLIIHHAVQGVSYHTAEGTSEGHTSPPPCPPCPFGPHPQIFPTPGVFCRTFIVWRSSQAASYTTNSHKHHIHHGWLTSWCLILEGFSLAFRDLAATSRGVPFKRK